MNFYVKNDNFYLDDRKVFLNSGEIHYFRIKRELWDRHLTAAAEAGLSTVSTYVPWAWHESKEGVFDFDGTTCPERDLKGWLRLCSEHGLSCIVKPGPFILAEFRGAGLPDWFIDQHSDAVRMRDSKGQKVPSDGVSLFNPKYIQKVTSWYNQIMPLISRHQASAGGPVIMMQVCNEIGVFSWLAHQADYCKEVQKRFSAYLSEKYNSITEINDLWGTNFADFSHVELPPDGRMPYASKGDRGRDYEWHMFWRKYYGDYLRMLAGMARKLGVTIPMYHNLPGWIYGSGYEFPVNITMYDDLFGEKSDIIFGVDHIPEFLSYRNMHDDRIINDITRAMQGRGPLFAAEFQSGSREYHVVTNPREMELFYKASVANGLTGWNYYMFSQGRNPERKGYSGSTFYWFNPLTPEAVRTSAFPLVKQMSSLIKTSEQIIVEAKRKAEICILFYAPYYATELEHPETGNSQLVFNASSIRRPAYFDGLLKALQVLNIDYDMADLAKTPADKLEAYKQVWAFCTDEMNAADQQTLIDYTAAGGNLVVFPHLPDREMSQKQCTLLRDALHVEPAGLEFIDSPLIDVLGHRDIKCANPQVVYDETNLGKAMIIARTISGKACGFSKTLGKGSILHLGTWIGYDTEGHKPVYEAILQKSGAQLRKASADNERLTVRQRFTENGRAMLFVANYYNEECDGQVTYTHPTTGEAITIPYMKESFLWPALYGILTPVCLRITDAINILHSTSDILGVDVTENQVLITLYGDRDLQGELVLEGPGINKIRVTGIRNEMINILHDSNRIILNYNHQHRGEMSLNLKII
ncbi:MAG TPA: beta-galactosidase [Bacteroidales bacterium]|nr:beta-galactosidase [Bacteroidales bacterium]